MKGCLGLELGRRANCKQPWVTGTSWQSSGWESTHQCREHKYDPLSEKIPYATAHVPQPPSLGSLESWCHNERAHAPQRKDPHDAVKIPCATTKTPCRQINIRNKKQPWGMKRHDRNVLKWTVVMVAQLSTFTENHWIVHLTMDEFYDTWIYNSIKLFKIPRWCSGKEFTCQCRRYGFWRSPGRKNDNPLQYSCLGNLMDRGAWHATVHGVTKSQPQLSN